MVKILSRLPFYALAALGLFAAFPGGTPSDPIDPEDYRTYDPEADESDESDYAPQNPLQAVLSWLFRVGFGLAIAGGIGFASAYWS